MLDPNLRFDIEADTPVGLNTGIVNVQPLLCWLDKRRIVYFWCDHYQYHTSEKVPEDKHKGIDGWDSWTEYRIHIYSPQIQFLKLSDYAMAKIRWQGVYYFSKSQQQPFSMKSFFREYDTK